MWAHHFIMKQKFIDAYMKTAETFAELSSARRLHVGALIVKDDRIISIGYNGMPSGWTNECEDVELYEDGGQALKTKPEVNPPLNLRANSRVSSDCIL